MRVGRHVLISGAALAGAVVGATASPVCSVFSRHPCAPTVCSVFHHGPCLPQYPFPLGENLQLTGGSTEAMQGKPLDHDHAIDTIHDLVVAMRARWQAPEADEAREGVQIW